MLHARAWWQRTSRAIPLAAALVVLAGCETVAVSALNSAASEIVNRDCSLERLFSRESICLDRVDTTTPPAMPSVFCFRNLGGVSCYTEPGEMEDTVRRDADRRLPLGS